MRTPEPLRNNPFRFRRRRSLHSKLYGEDRSRPIRSTGNMSHYPGGMGRVNPREYISASQEQYMPHPGFMQMSQGDYEPYDELQDVSMSDFGRTADEFHFAAMELAGNFTEHVPQYEDGLMTEELLQEILESMREENGEPIPIQFDFNEIASHILAARDQNEGKDIDPNLQDTMLDIQMAVEQAKAESLTALNPEPMNFGTAIPQDFFEQQEQMPENQFDDMQFAEFGYGASMEPDIDAQEEMFEQPIEEMEPMADLGPQTLENIVEAEQRQYEDGMPDDMSEMPDAMNEGPVEQMYETPEQMEPYPEPRQDGYGMMPQEMYVEQMQEMMDPYMMPGPFGPMPGPGP